MPYFALVLPGKSMHVEAKCYNLSGEVMLNTNKSKACSCKAGVAFGYRLEQRLRFPRAGDRMTERKKARKMLPRVAANPGKPEGKFTLAKLFKPLAPGKTNKHSLLKMSSNNCL